MACLLFSLITTPLLLSLLAPSSAQSKMPITGFIKPRIVGGVAATSQQFPWAAFGIVKGVDPSTNSNYLEACSGALISDYSSITCTSNANCASNEACVRYIDGNSYCQATWVVTAAHCLVNGFSSQPISGYDVPVWIFGNADRTDPSTVTGLCTEIFIHPSYNPTTQYYDVALCKLGNTPSTLSRGVAAFGDDSGYTDGDLVTVAGWGRTADDATLGAERVMRYVNVHTSTNSACQPDLNNRLASLNPRQSYTLISAELCAGGDSFGDAGKDSCQGDSGGPLFMQYQDGTPFMLGITSQGWGCAAGTPGVYTRVASISQWIIDSQTCSREFREQGRCSQACSFRTKSGVTTCSTSSFGVTPTSPPAFRPTTRAPTKRPTTRPPTRRPTPPPTARTWRWW